MKVITKEEEAEHYAEVLKGGLIGGAVGLSIGPWRRRFRVTTIPGLPQP